MAKLFQKMPEYKHTIIKIIEKYQNMCKEIKTLRAELEKPTVSNATNKL